MARQRAGGGMPGRDRFMAGHRPVPATGRAAVVDANFTDRGDQRRVGEHSSGGDRDVGPDVLRGQLFQRVLEIEDLEAESGRESWKGRNSPMCSRMTRASG
jgi:hypothetical protein